jgi:hypothetical protein
MEQNSPEFRFHWLSMSVSSATDRTENAFRYRGYGMAVNGATRRGTETLNLSSGDRKGDSNFTVRECVICC